MGQLTMTLYLKQCNYIICNYIISIQNPIGNLNKVTQNIINRLSIQLYIF